MKREEIVDIFNCMIRGTPVSFNEKLVPLISDYLTDINYKNSDKIISLIISNPNLAEYALPKIIDYYERKYVICSLIFNNKILCYQ